MTREEFAALAKDGILLDGATGSNMYQAGMPKNVCVEAWLLENPDAVMDLQRRYAEAGSQIVYAPTFGANRLSLEKHGLQDEVARLNSGLVANTKKAVGADVLVAGDMTTTGELLEPIGELEEEELFEIYREQVKALYEAGVDLFVAETLMCVQEAEIALRAVRDVCDLPFMATLTVQQDGRAFFGGSAAEAVETLPKEGADAVGINCSFGPEQLDGLVSEMKAKATVPVIVKPNAGMPVTDASGNAIYPMQAEEFAAHMKRLIGIGAQVVGGCCGTTPACIAALLDVLRS